MNRMGTRGRCGTAGLRSIVAERMDLGTNPESVAETRFARILLDSPLPRPRLQFKVQDGDFRARLDAAWPEVMLGVEIDGWQWHASKSARLRDARRQNHLERLGWMILRFYWEDVVSDPGYVIAEITAAYRHLTLEHCG